MIARTQNIGDLYEALEVVQAQLRRLRRVVDMFTLARADASAYCAHPESFYLDEVVMESASCADYVRGHHVQIDSTHVATDTPYVGDEGLIRQMVLILLDNAVKYTDNGGNVSISLQRSRDGYDISVTDTGRGIPEVDQPHIDRFYRVDKLGPDPIRVWVVERDLDCPSQNGSLTSIAAPSSLFVPGQTEAYSEYSCLSTAGQPDPESASTSLSTMHT